MLFLKSFLEPDSSPTINEGKRALNFGKFGNTELSIWLNSITEQANRHPVIKISIKNEGRNNLSNLFLTVKTTKNISILNRHEIFGTNKNRIYLGKLTSKKSVSYLARYKINHYEEKAFIIAQVFSESKSGQLIKLEARLDLFRQVSRLGA